MLGLLRRAPRPVARGPSRPGAHRYDMGMGQHRGISAYLHGLSRDWRRPFAYNTSAAVTSLVRRTFADPSMAGESHRFLALSAPVSSETARTEPQAHARSDCWLTIDSDKLDRNIAERRLVVSYTGSGKSWSYLDAALRAERRWREMRRATQDRVDFCVALPIRIPKAVRRTAPKAFAASPIGRHVSLSPVLTSGIPALNARVQGVRQAIGALREFGSVEADWASLQADLAYWRRTADELWRLVAGPADPPQDSVEVIFVDSAPCGIRRLTAVRVPRAPGSGRPSPNPNSLLLAAA